MGVYSQVLLQHENLQNRIKHSKEFLKDVRTEFRNLQGGRNNNACVFAAGSLGRFEAGRRSDLDVFIIGDDGRKNQRSLSRLQEIEIFSDLIRLNEKLNLPPFSGDGRFLKIHELNDLINETGDSKDDSENLFTTRLLLILESQALTNDILYKKALNSILENYFRDGKAGRDFRPLFLLNDILRYWRTLCLNYERDRKLSKPWWKRNLNLKFSRKLTIFSTVLCIVSKKVTNASEFVELTKLVPLERLACALDVIDDASLEDRFEHILTSYEEFLAAKSFDDLNEKNPDLLVHLTERADVFGEFMYDALHSQKLDTKLVKYLSI